MNRIIQTLKWLTNVSRVANKNCFHIVIDYIKLRRTYGISKEEYSKYRFYDADENFIKSFLPLLKAWDVWRLLNPSNYACVARDKYLSHCLLSSVEIPTSVLFLYYNPQLASNTDRVVYNYDGVVQAIKKQNIKQCVIKVAQDSAHGQGVIVCHDILFENGECILKRYNGKKERLRNILGDQPLLFESLIKQNTQFSSFNASSVNTIRMMTALYPNNNVKLYAAFIKIGREGSDVDNAGGGGNVDCAVDIKTGELYNTLEFNSWENIRNITHHPDSNTKIEGEYIDNWDAIVKEVCSFQAKIPQLKVIGWDIAVTENGPVVIEINNWWDTTGQLFLNRGWKPEVMECYNAWIEHQKKHNK